MNEAKIDVIATANNLIDQVKELIHENAVLKLRARAAERDRMRWKLLVARLNARMAPETQKWCIMQTCPLTGDETKVYDWQTQIDNEMLELMETKTKA
jgi:hypothetical protein